MPLLLDVCVGDPSGSDALDVGLALHSEGHMVGTGGWVDSSVLPNCCWIVIRSSAVTAPSSLASPSHLPDGPPLPLQEKRPDQI